MNTNSTFRESKRGGSEHDSISILQMKLNSLWKRHYTLKAHSVKNILLP